MIEWKITNSQVCLETFKCDQAMSWEALKYHGVPHKDNPHMVFVEKEKQTSTAAAEGQVKSGLSSFPSCYSVAEERVEKVCCQGLWGVLPSQGACHLGWHRALWAHKIKVTFNTLCLQCSCHEALLIVSQDVGILHTPPPPRPNYTTPHHTSKSAIWSKGEFCHQSWSNMPYFHIYPPSLWTFNSRSFNFPLCNGETFDLNSSESLRWTRSQVRIAS